MTDARTIAALRRLSAAERPKRPRFADASAPRTTAASVGDDEIVGSDGRILRRRRIVLDAIPCRSGLCSMCPLPAESAYAKLGAPSDAAVLTQFERALALPGRIDVATLYHDGNFFSSAEIGGELRRDLLRVAASSGLRELIVESLPRFVTDEALSEASAILGDVSLTCAMGLQCADDLLRRTAILSTFDWSDFAAATAALRRFGMRAGAFLLLGIPFLSPEEAEEELLSGIARLDDELGIDDPTICPLRIEPGTLAHRVMLAGFLVPPTLGDARRFVRLARSERPSARARVALSLLDERGGKNRAAGCGSECEAAALADVMAFSSGRPFSSSPPSCACSSARGGRRPFVPSELAVRVEAFLSAMSVSV
jgi:radical SAM enzyme (TIGR01210 family)